MPDSELRAKVPPLQMFTYMIRKIMYPDLLYDRIPDLLDLVANVEQYRHVISGKAKGAIGFDTFYKYQDPSIPGLNEEEIKVLENIQKNGKTYRGIYVKIIQQFLLLVSADFSE